MTTLTLSTLLILAQEGAPGGQQGAPLWTMLIYLGFFFAIFYFLLIRPQKKRQQEHQNLVSSLKNGDEVVTAGGIHGRIANIKDSTVMLKVADNLRIEVERASIERVTAKNEKGTDEAPAQEETSK